MCRSDPTFKCESLNLKQSLSSVGDYDTIFRDSQAGKTTDFDSVMRRFESYSRNHMAGPFNGGRSVTLVQLQPLPNLHRCVGYIMFFRVSSNGRTAVSKTASLGSMPNARTIFLRVVQFGRTLALGVRGRRFKSYHGDHFILLL